LKWWINQWEHPQNHQQIQAGWWYTYPSEKYEFVSWDYHSQHMEKSKIFQTTNQQVYQ